MSEETERTVSVPEALLRWWLGMVTDHWFVGPQVGFLVLVAYLTWDVQLLNRPAPAVVITVAVVWGALVYYEGMTLERRRRAGAERREAIRQARHAVAQARADAHAEQDAAHKRWLHSHGLDNGK